MGLTCSASSLAVLFICKQIHEPGPTALLQYHRRCSTGTCGTIPRAWFGPDNEQGVQTGWPRALCVYQVDAWSQGCQSFSLSPLAINYTPMGTAAPLSSPAAPHKLPYGHSSTPTLPPFMVELHPPRCWTVAGDLALVSDGGTPQPCRWISMPRTRGSQCQMEQLSLKSFFSFL